MFLKKVKAVPGADELAKLEDAASRREANVAHEVEQLAEQARALARQVAEVRAAMAEAEKIGAEDPAMRARLDRVELPRPDATAMRTEVDHAKRAALVVREGAADRLEAQAAQWQQSIDAMGRQLEADAAVIRRAYEQARQARVRALEAPPRPAVNEAASAKTMISARPVPPAMKPKAGPENRRSPRVAMQTVIDFGSDSNFYSGFSTNISDGGVFIATVKVMRLGTEIDLSFTLPNGEVVKTKGVVKWVREVNDQIPDSFPGIGVQFEDLPESAFEAIHGFVAEREPLFFPE